MRRKLFDLAPMIFSAIGCVGVVTTAMCAVRDSRKAVRVIDDMGLYDAIEKPGVKEEVKATWQCYIPTVASAVGTITCIVLSRRISAKQIASITAAAGYLAANRDNYRNKIKEIAGGDVLKKVDRDFNIERFRQQQTIEETGNGNLICLEGYSGRWFKSSEEAVREALQRYADRFGDGEYVNLNDLYDELDIVSTHFGAERGYAPGSDWFDMDFNYDITLIPYSDLAVTERQNVPEGAPLLVIDIYTYPMECYMDV